MVASSTRTGWKPVRRFACILSGIILLTSFAARAEEAGSGERVMSRAEVEEMVQEAGNAYLSDPEVAEVFNAEFTTETRILPDVWGGKSAYEVHTLTHNGQSMSFLMEIIGEPDEQGLYPLYITLHGGGGAPAEENDGEWTNMFSYYKESVDSGIYVACRGITDTWDLHFQEASYPLYDRLIQYLIFQEYADPNRVYLLGFSAGGDGVYQIAPRMADRFAAVNMSSGHPNGVSLLNAANLPFSLQAGIRDYYSESAMRSVRCAEFEQVLQKYHETYGFGYEHQVLIHVPAGHNYNDYSDTESIVLADPEDFASRAAAENMLDAFCETTKAFMGTYDVSEMSYLPTEWKEAYDDGLTDLVANEMQLDLKAVNANAVAYVSRFAREPAPMHLVWDLSTRAASREVTSFYWLQAEADVNQGVITASFDPASNTYTVEPDADVNGDFFILVSPRLADVSRPVGISTPKGDFTVMIQPSEEVLTWSIYTTGDPEMACVAAISYDELDELY